MSTSNPNASVSQVAGGRTGNGGFCCVSSSLNAIGKWGTALTGILQGKAVATGTSGVAVGAKGATGLPGSVSSTSLVLILLVVGVLIFMATRK
jgi:hypothetical protein